MTKFKQMWDAMPPESKRDVAKKAGTSLNYLSQIANGHRKAGVSTYIGLSKAIPGLSLSDLRLDAG